MNRVLRGTTLLLALLAGCVTTGGGSVTSNRFKQADTKFPPGNGEFAEDFERGFVQNINTHHQAAGMAASSGNLDQARAEWATEAQALSDFADKFTGSDWHVSFRYNAAKYFLYARQEAKAVEQAEKLLIDPDANDTSRVMAAKLAYAATNGLANAKVQAGQLEAIRLPLWDQRKTTPLTPRSPPGEWKRIVDYADTYVKLAASDPDNKKASNDRFLPTTPAQVALSAAQIEYAFDNMEDARTRFAAYFDAWPGEIDISAVKLYLQTFLALNDTAGYEAALPKQKALVSAALAKATEPKSKEALGKVLEQLNALEMEAGYNHGKRLLEAGKFAEAAATFEAFATANPDNANVSLALYQAGVAWEKANQLDKAASLREQVIARFPESKEAEGAQLQLAALRAKQGKGEEAVKLYRAFVEKYPASTIRCSAIFNLGRELDQLRRSVDAAKAYSVFGGDAQCAKDDPNSAANVLFRAGELYEKAGKRPEAKKAYQACGDVAGVTDTVWKVNQAEARKRAKR
jgi:tetratricopeptide (TPR) repeat protein